MYVLLLYVNGVMCAQNVGCLQSFTDF